MKSGFYCVDCAKECKENYITKEQATKTGVEFGRGLCQDCAEDRRKKEQK